MKGFIKRNLVSSAAIVISVTLTLLLSVLEIVWFGNFELSKAVISLLVLLAVSYLMVRYVVNQFIHEKIKLIYKTIHNLKTPKSQLKAILQKDEDVLENVNKEVISWAETKQQEIQFLKEQEEYRRDFLGNVSHELKTPIFNIQGYVHTLLDGAKMSGFGPDLGVDFAVTRFPNIL